MTKITEASNLGALGVPEDLVSKIHKRHNLNHDEKFDQLKTKGQMQAMLKDGRLILGISPEGKIASLGKESGWAADKMIYITVDGSKYSSRSMKDALAYVPGRGWKWFASKSSNAGDVRPQDFTKKHRDRQDADTDLSIMMSDKLNRVYGKRLKDDANKYADEIRDFLIHQVDKGAGDEENIYKRDKSFDDIHQAYKIMKVVGSAERPFYALQKFRDRYQSHPDFSRFIAGVISDSGYYYEKERDLAKFLRNEKNAVAKIAQYALNMLKRDRDNAIMAKGDDKISKNVKLAKVKKAWESYKADGSIKKL